MRLKNCDPSICVITPTIGRPTLARTLASADLGLFDQWLIVGDGPQPAARQIVAERGGPNEGFYYSEIPHPTGDHGNKLRDLAMSIAFQDYFVFLDDDDIFMPGAFKIIKREIKEHYPAPIIFKMISGGQIIWKNREVTAGNVGGSQFICPNKLGLIGTWDNGHGHRSDIEFILETLRRYGSGWRRAIHWAGDIIIRCRPGETYND